MEIKNIDDYIKSFQLRTVTYEDMIEWIPFERLINVKRLVKEGSAVCSLRPGHLVLSRSRLYRF